jgi:D-glycero-D-manno-heptose 1,7-bisphosphate phosphatase
MPIKPYAFLDRDGTVIVEKNYLADPDGVELLPGAAAGMRCLVELGYGLILVTNQAGVGRGYFGEEAVRAVNGRLVELLAAEGLVLDGIYYCPHHPDAGCECRKPKPGMIRQAQSEFPVDMARSVMVGDKPSDIELGRAVGLRTILVETGYGAEHGADTGADAVVQDLLAAAAWLAGETGEMSR